VVASAHEGFVDGPAVVSGDLEITLELFLVGWDLRLALKSKNKNFT
jgi:hypothetical protein